MQHPDVLAGTVVYGEDGEVIGHEYLTGAFLAAHSGFAQDTGIIIPFNFRNGEHMSVDHAAFNAALSAQRQQVECSYGGVQQRWPRIKHTNVDDPTLVALGARVAFALYNLLIRKGIVTRAVHRRNSHGTMLVGGVPYPAWAAQWEADPTVTPSELSYTSAQGHRAMLVEYVKHFQAVNQGVERYQLHSCEYVPYAQDPLHACQIPVLELEYPLVHDEHEQQDSFMVMLVDDGADVGLSASSDDSSRMSGEDDVGLGEPADGGYDDVGLEEPADGGYAAQFFN